MGSNDAPESRFQKFVASARLYKEFIGLLIGLVSAISYAMSYVATKTDVEIINCRLEAKTEAIKHKLKTEEISKDLINLKSQQKMSSRTTTQEEASRLEVNIKQFEDKLNIELQAQTDSEDEAYKGCQKTVLGGR